MNDFPDWLSPILVKELRQGLRSRAFVSLFILMQAVMAFMVLLAILPESRSGSTIFFWMIIVAGFLFFLPVRGLGVVSSEIKGQTMELLSLTQLSSWRIVFGKWVALVAQTSLFLFSILPYVGLRYFLGDVDLVTEMSIVGLLFAGSLVLTAIAVGLSAMFTNQLYLVGLGLGGLFMPYLFFAIGTLLFRDVMRHGTGTFNPNYLWLLAPWVGLLFMEVSTSKIAPAGEGRRLFQRLIAIGVVATCVILGVIFGKPASFANLALALLFPLFIIDSTTPIPSIPTLYRAPKRFRFSRIPVLRSVMRWLSEPDWIRGLQFTLIIFLLLTLSALRELSIDDLQMIVLGIGTFLTPLLVIGLFKSIKQKAGLFFTMQAVLFLFSLPSIIYKKGFLLIAHANPATAFWVRAMEDDSRVVHPAMPAGIITLLIAAGVIFIAYRQRPLRREMQLRAAELSDR